MCWPCSVSTSVGLPRVESQRPTRALGNVDALVSLRVGVLLAVVLLTLGLPLVGLTVWSVEPSGLVLKVLPVGRPGSNPISTLERL